ncbi:MAG TPA: citrate synthase [Streptosporangiaceae bacterium]
MHETEVRTGWITAEAAAERLGVKRATLYAYVSRGVLMRRRAADGRGSLFDPREIERLALRGRPRHAPSGAELVIESAVTEISGERLSYRGHEVTALAASHSFEDVATLLWTADTSQELDDPAAPPRPGEGRSSGRVPRPQRDPWLSNGQPQRQHVKDPAAQAPWRATAAAVAAGSAAQSALPPSALPIERLQVIVPALAATDPLRLHLAAPAVIAAAQAMIAGMVDCLPARRPPAPAAGRPSAGIAGRLWGKLCPVPPAPGLLGALRSALVLLADHELAASTLAARVAASVRADPYAVVATGLGALGGPLHGGASLGAEGMLAAAATPAEVPVVVGDLLRRTGRVPGFGHFLYPAGDPRAVCLLGLTGQAVPESPRLAVASAILAEMRRRALPEPNIDFALAVLADVTGMITGAGEAVFAVARTAGWIAHALEEYARNAPLRPRAVYTGPPAR